MSRPHEDPAGRGPRRSCIACRQSLPQGQLIRFVCAPDGALLVDYGHRLPGRGAYVCLKPDCLRQALRRNAFSRALRQSCRQPDEAQLLAQLQQACRQRILNLLGMARKAGLLCGGQQAVSQSLQRPHEIALVLVATDMSAPLAARLRQRLDQLGLPYQTLFDRQQLAEALGTALRSTLVIKKSSLAQTLQFELGRYREVMGEV